MATTKTGDSEKVAEVKDAETKETTTVKAPEAEVVETKVEQPKETDKQADEDEDGNIIINPAVKIVKDEKGFPESRLVQVRQVDTTGLAGQPVDDDGNPVDETNAEPPADK